VFANFFVCPDLYTITRAATYTSGILFFIVTLFMTIPAYCGFCRQREKATPAVGIEFVFKKKVFKNSTS